MKKLIPIILVVVIIVAAIIIVPKYMHTCDACDKFFMGYAYEPSMVYDAADKLGELFGVESEESEKMEKVCKNCAIDQHILTEASEIDKFRIDPWAE